MSGKKEKYQYRIHRKTYSCTYNAHAIQRQIHVEQNLKKLDDKLFSLKISPSKSQTRLINQLT